MTALLERILVVVLADVAWNFPGRRGQLAGAHRGRDAVLAFLANVDALTDGTFRLDLLDVTASDDNAVALFRGHGARAGRTLDNPTALRIRFEDGRIREFWEFVWDLDHAEDFWT